VQGFDQTKDKAERCEVEQYLQPRDKLGCEVKLYLNTGNFNTDVIVLSRLNIWLQE